MTSRKTKRAAIKKHSKSVIATIKPIDPLLCFGSAAMCIAGYPPYNLWWLSFIALLPFLWVIDSKKTILEHAVAGFLMSFFFVIIGFYWIAYVATNFGGLPWIVGKLVLLGYAIIGELEFCIFAALVYCFFKFFPSKRKWAIVFLPFLYTGIDFLYPKLFPGTLGHIIYGWFSAIQLVEWTGVYIFTIALLFCNLLFFTLAKNLLKLPSKFEMKTKWVVVGLLLVASFFTSAHFIGKKRIAELEAFEKQNYKPFRISIIQANIGDLEKLASENGYTPAIKKVLSTYRNMSIESVRRFKPRLVVWPETAFPYLYSHYTDAHANLQGSAKDEWIGDVVEEIKTPLFFGTYSMTEGRDFNSAFLVAPRKTLLGKYKKSILLAFGEYVPLGPLSPLVHALIPSIAEFGRGVGAELFEFEGIRFAPQICYEGIFPSHSVDGVKLGADVLLNITNDSWFGAGSEPWAHLGLTVFRSIELRRPMIRATNTGISVYVDSTGRIREQTKLFEPAFFEIEPLLPRKGVEQPKTMYLVWGEIFGKISAAVAAAFLFVVLVKKRKENVRGRRGRFGAV